MLNTVFKSLKLMYGDMPVGFQVIFWGVIAIGLLWMIF